MYKLTFLLEDSIFPTFEAAFRALYTKVKNTEGLTWQVLETSIWIEHTQTHEIMFFYQARDKAHTLGLLTGDGKLLPS